MAGNIFMRFPEGRHKALTLSYDDGAWEDIRLVERMVHYGLKGTFNINSGLYPRQGEKTIRMPLSRALELYQPAGMEVALHSLTHPVLSALPENLCTYEILQDRLNHERDYNCIIRGMAYPEGTVSVSDSVVSSLRQCGIAYARTTVSTERFDIPTDWLRLPATCHHKNPRLMELAERFAEDPFDRSPGLFYLWGHSREFALERPDNNWGILESFGSCLGRREDIWYATNIELYNYVHAYRQLVFSTDGRRVWNPTAMTLWFKANGGLRVVAPGETKEW